jgi:hypothetical protein
VHDLEIEDVHITAVTIGVWIAQRLDAAVLMRAQVEATLRSRRNTPRRSVSFK